MFDIKNGIAVVAFDNPPVNSLGHALRDSIVRKLEAAQAHPEVRAVVLTGNERAFSAGADVSEFGAARQMQAPLLRDVIAAVDSCSKPVVAAIQGFALGGGLELALACHGRVARDTAQVGLPEITLGLIPGSGGTQRLPRLIEPAAALSLMLTGLPRTAASLAESGLFDAVVTGDVVDAAVRQARRLADAGTPYPRARDVLPNATSIDSAIRTERDRLNPRKKLQPAYGALLNAFSALHLPFDEGLRRERELFLALVPTTAARALRYQFKAERDAQRLPGAQRAQPRQVGSVAVVGAGTMGTGIAICAIDADLDVVLLEQDKEALVRGRERIANHYRERVAAGKVNQIAAAASENRLVATLDWTELAQAMWSLKRSSRTSLSRRLFLP